MKIITLVLIENEDFKETSKETPMCIISKFDLNVEIPENIDGVIIGPLVKDSKDLVKKMCNEFNSHGSFYLLNI